VGARGAPSARSERRAATNRDVTAALGRAPPLARAETARSAVKSTTVGSMATDESGDDACVDELEELASLGSFRADLRTGALRWSRGLYRVMRIPLDVEPSRQAFLDHIHPDDRDWLAEANARYRDDGGMDVIHHVRLVGGEPRYLHMRAQVIADATGAPSHARGTIQDVTGRVLLERELRRARALAEHAMGVSVIVGSDGAIRHATPSFERFTSSARAASLSDLVVPEDRGALLDALGRSVAAPGAPLPWRARFHGPECGTRTFEGTATSYLAEPAIAGIVLSASDVTERAEVEATLRAREEVLRHAVSVSGFGFFDHDQRTDAISCSPRLREIYGFGPDEPVPIASIVERMHPDDAARAGAAIARAHDPTGDGTFEVEHRVCRPDGEVRWVATRSQTFFEGEGAQRRPVRTVGAIVDNTERHRREEALRLKDEAIATSTAGFAMADTAGRITYVNPSFVRMWRLPSEAAARGRDAASLLDRRHTEETLRALLENGSYEGELTAVRHDGSTFDVMLTASVVRDRAGSVTSLVGWFVDVTDANRLRTQLAQANKMESVGRLAGGVAHDFNNILTVIKGNVDLALADLPAKHPVRDELVEAGRAADSAAALTQQLLAFSRKQIIKPRVLDLNEVISQIHGMVRRLLGEDIELRVVYGQDLWPVRFDPSQCEQILLNLAVNARDAMPDGGQLLFETTNVTLDDAYTGRHGGVTPGDYVMLAVSDTGAGMSDSVRSHIFEPFFTTKGPGAGTGLGLAMVYGAVSQNGGRIEVYSEVGEGSTFKVYLPRAASAAARRGEEAQRAAPVGGRERVVVVEDDAAVRALAVRVLTSAGYAVVAFGRPVEALDAIRSGSFDLDLLVTDVVMPGMNGRELAGAVTAVKPGVRVLFTSGYTANVIVHHGVLTDGVEFIAKPYTVDALVRRVREVLDTPRTTA